jgi:hypothetical protein
MVINLKSKRNKLKSRTPVVFAMPKEQKDKMRSMFDSVIADIESKKETPTVWYNACFRVMQCYEIAKHTYEASTVAQISPILNRLLNKYKPELDNWFKFTDGELESLIAVHEAMCLMEDETTRRVQLDAVHITNNFMKNLIG